MPLVTYVRDGAIKDLSGVVRLALGVGLTAGVTMWLIRFVARYGSAFVFDVPAADYKILEGAYEREQRRANDLQERVTVLENIRPQRHAIEVELHTALVELIRQFDGIYLKHNRDMVYAEAHVWWLRLSSELKPQLPVHEFRELEHAWTDPLAFRQGDTVVEVPNEIAGTVAALHGVKNALWSWCQRDGH